MSFLYLTADAIGTETGGGVVTKNEYQALRELAEENGHPLQVISRKELEAVDQGRLAEPWRWDSIAFHIVKPGVKLAHVYSGTFSSTVQKLKDYGAKVVYTIAAHDRDASRREHEKFGVPFAQLYPHLCVPELWERYIAGYRKADKIVCPGSCAADSVRKYGGQFWDIETIPHGCDIPETVKPLPEMFTVGYMGAIGCDKGLVYLLQAWKKLAYKDSLLILAGKDSSSSYVTGMIAQVGGGNVIQAGWQDNVADFYSGCSVYIQPSVTEGFGLEILEAMSYARPVICSRAAGACDLIPDGMRFDPCDSEGLAQRIDEARKSWDLQKVGLDCREIAREHTWSKIRERYKEVWRRLLN